MKRSHLFLLLIPLLIISCGDMGKSSGRAGTVPATAADTMCAIFDNTDPVMCDKKRQEAIADYYQNKMKYYVVGFLPAKKFVQELRQLNVEVISTSCMAINNGDGCYNSTIDSIVQARTGKTIGIMRRK
jgi:hypothetical protein